ncbi:uncharacterized protein A4U43_C04F32160 [Asparagus officinalis]|uniref:Uncharacterized protein n=1 Tax=Asparagus officinalis TaxID=4686 RepID=A0A5P1FAE3_ASPOF|nr:uncharacterized protein A4U43_C08F22930 [Asparagus officinalis]ONK73490.1 uncharacterized protein A4U43_C04F32160 [Asparagus officinalis]
MALACKAGYDFFKMQLRPDFKASHLEDEKDEEVGFEPQSTPLSTSTTDAPPCSASTPRFNVTPLQAPRLL